MTLPQDPQAADDKPQAHILAKNAFWMFAKKYTLKPLEVMTLMGLSSDQLELAAQYAKNRSIPDTEEMFRKIGILLGIHRTLESLYSFSPTFRYGFMHMQWSQLEWKSPIEFLQEAPAQLVVRLERIQSLLEGEASKKIK